MSMTLFLWKAPVTDDLDEVNRLLGPYLEREDDSAFTPSDDLTIVANELLRRFPDSEGGPWADTPPEPSERLLDLSIRWGADNSVIDAIADLAREHELVLYDPQGPDVQLPGDQRDTAPVPPIAPVDYLKLVAMSLVAGGIFWLGWRIEVSILHWLLMIVGGFVLIVALFLLGALVFGSKDDLS